MVRGFPAFEIRRHPRGMTLVELLIVVAVMVILIGVALPVMRTAIESGRVRESARQLSTTIELVKAKAVESGLPVGLWIETEQLSGSSSLSNTNLTYATRLYIAETPRPYSGDFDGATAALREQTTTTGGVTTTTYWAEFDGTSATLPYMGVKAGDHIRFDFKGPRYRISSVVWETSPTPDKIYFEVSTARGTPAPRTGGSYPYQILRQPQRTLAGSIELARDAVIDLTYSGQGDYTGTSTDTGHELSATTAPIVIVFNPAGYIERILGIGAANRPQATIHLLVGRIDQLSEPAPDSKLPISGDDSTKFAFYRNVVDPESVWVSIGHQTGKVTVAENAWSLRPATPNFLESLQAAREFAQSAQSIGGR